MKLHGVDNVLGHQLAVHEMAGILGVGVPQVFFLLLLFLLAQCAILVFSSIDYAAAYTHALRALVQAQAALIDGH